MNGQQIKAHATEVNDNPLRWRADKNGENLTKKFSHDTQNFDRLLRVGLLNHAGLVFSLLI
jgi:hypothetical protein